jgi:RNA polymerase sigma-70 factor, ECF subfamily
MTQRRDADQASSDTRRSSSRAPASSRDGTTEGLRQAAQTASPDVALFTRLLANDPSAFEELVREATPRLLPIARRLLRREEDAQDAVQETFLSALKSLESFDHRSRLTTWLHRICVNVCLMKLRTRRRKPETSIEGLLPQFVSDGHQTRANRAWRDEQNTGLEAAELNAIVREKIEELPADYREVLLLRDIAELDTDATAAELNISTAAVKTRLHRARQALRALLEPVLEQGR